MLYLSMMITLVIGTGYAGVIGADGAGRQPASIGGISAGVVIAGVTVGVAPGAGTLLEPIVGTVQVFMSR